MDRFTGRRKLIRGSLSAPLVLTVAASPAAQAARGSWEACLLRAGLQKTQDWPDPLKANPDGFLRYTAEVYSGTLKTTSDTPTPTGSDADAAGKKKHKPSKKSTGTQDGDALGSNLQPQNSAPPSFYKLPDNRYYPVSAELTCQPGYDQSAFESITSTGDSVRVLLYVDGNGVPVAYGNCPPSTAADGFPVTGSCAASFGIMVNRV